MREVGTIPECWTLGLGGRGKGMPQWLATGIFPFTKLGKTKNMLRFACKG